MVDDIQTRIKRIIEAMKQDRTIEINSDTDLFGVGILDSFGMIEYLSMLEKEFNIHISNDDLIPQNLWSIEASVRTIRKYLS